MSQVLVVDDSLSIRQLVRSMLEPEGYELSEATDGVEALASLRSAPRPVVVLLDYQMPNMNGGDVLKTVASEGAPLSAHEFIMLSANVSTFPEDFIELLRHLSIRILSKPVDKSVLVSAVAQAADRLASPADEPIPWVAENE
jgi:CheY-like chemotaxis protein